MERNRTQFQLWSRTENIHSNSRAKNRSLRSYLQLWNGIAHLCNDSSASDAAVIATAASAIYIVERNLALKLGDILAGPM